MNFKLAWVLLAVLLLAVGGLLVATLLDDSPATGDILLAPLAGLKEEDIETVELVRAEPAEEKIVLTRAGKDAWDITEPGRGKADPFAVRKVIGDLLALKPTPSKDVTDNKTVHGLDKPGLRVTLTAKGGQTATLNVGDTSIGRNALTFVTTGARPDRPVAVLRGDLDGLFRPDATGKDDKSGKSWALARWLSDYRRRSFFQGEKDLMAEAESITVAKGGAETKLVRNAAGEWTFAAPAGYGVADTEGDPQAAAGVFTGVRPLVNAITALQVTDGGDFVEKPEVPEKYGLAAADKDVLRIEVKPKAGPAETLFVGKRVDDKSDKFFVKLATDAVVAKAAAVPERVAAFAKVATDPSALRDRTLVPASKQNVVDAIDVTAGGTTTKLRRIPTAAEARWVLYGGPTDPQYAGTAVANLLQTLTQPRLAKEVLPAPYDAVFADAEKKAEIKLWYDGTEKPAAEKDPAKLPPEPKLKGDGKPAVTLVVGKKEADVVYVRRVTADGIRTDFKVPEATLAALTRGRLDYLDPALKPFPQTPAKKLTIVRGGETFTVESDGKPAPAWKFLTPERYKGQVADAGKVAEFLGMLPIMNATRVAAEAPAEADLAKYGVGAAPRLKVVVGFDPPTEPERVYEFGNETEEKNLVYLRTNTKPAVVTVATVFYTRLATEDLRDRLLYQIDKANVKAVELTGWKQELKQPTKYRFERTPTGWAVKEPAGVTGTVDPAKMEIFLATLAAPRAVNYLPGGQKPEQGFDVATAPNTLQIKFELENHPGLAINLGNETDGGANYFGWTVAKKDDVFTISTVGLREFKDKPTAFMKP